MTDIVVVGGGISGLAATYYVRMASAHGDPTLRCHLIEGDRKFGGKIATHRQGDFVIEGGPDSFLARKPAVLDLCRELGLADRLIGTTPGHGGTSVLSGGRLVKLPEGLTLIVPTRITPFLRSPLISWPGKLRMGLDLVIPPRRSLADESVAGFVRRRLGEEALRKIGQPLMAGIHVADPERLSLLATFPQFAEIERQHGSLIRGILTRSKQDRSGNDGRGPGAVTESGGLPAPPSSPFLSFRDGMGELVDGLVNRIAPDTLIRGRRVVRLERLDGAAGGLAPGYQIHLDDGSTISADAVVLATPASIAADLVAEFNPGLASDLRAIRYVSTATVSLGYRRGDIAQALGGSGFIVPRCENRQINACTWSSQKFVGRAPADHVLLRAFVGGFGRESLVDVDDDRLVRVVRAELQQILGVAAEPVVADLFRWRQGIPQYDVGHLERVAALERHRDPGLFLAGSAYHGAGVPDCIATARRVATEARAYLHSRASEQPVADGALG